MTGLYQPEPTEAYEDPTPDRLTAEGVAGLLGVSRSTISSYASRGQMPKPSPCPCCGHGATWDAAEIREWAANRPGRTGRPRLASPVADQPETTGRLP